MQILCPKSAIPIDEFKNRLNSSFGSADILHKMIVANKDYRSLNKVQVTSCIKELIDTSQKIEKSIEKELATLELSVLCGRTCKNQRVFHTIRSVLDSISALSGGVVLYLGNDSTRVLGIIMLIAGQFFSKSNYISSFTNRNTRYIIREQYACDRWTTLGVLSSRHEKNTNHF